MDPELTCSLPAYQTASGATDMISHVLERYFTNTEDVGLTDRICEALIKTIMEAVKRALADPMDYGARADLMWAGMLAQNDSCGVGRVQDWGCHQMEHELSAFYECAHGAGLAGHHSCVDEVYHASRVSRYAQFAVRVFGCEMNFADPEATAREGIERLTAFFKEIVCRRLLQRSRQSRGYSRNGGASV